MPREAPKELTERRERLRIIEETRARLLGAAASRKPVQSSNIAKDAADGKSGLDSPASKFDSEAETEVNPVKAPTEQSKVNDIKKQLLTRAPSKPKPERIDTEKRNVEPASGTAQADPVKLKPEKIDTKKRNVEPALGTAQVDLMKVEDELERTKMDMDRKVSEYETRIRKMEEDYQKRIKVFESKLNSSSGTDERTEKLEQQLEDLRYRLDKSVSKDEFDRVQREYEEEISHVTAEQSQLQRQIEEREREYQTMKTESAALELELKGALEDRRILEHDLEEAREKVRRSEDIEAHMHSLEEENESLRSELEQVQRLKRTIEEQDMEIQDLNHALKNKENAMARQLGSRNNTMAFDEEAKKSMDALMGLYEEAQHENENLRAQLLKKAANPEESVMVAMESLQNENAKLVESVRHLEDYVTELTDLFKDSEKMRKELEVELAGRGSRGGSRASSRPATRYISDDTELLSFIETMTQKVEAARAEAEQMRAENEQLRISKPKEYDSGLGTSLPTTPSSAHPSRQLSESREREEKLENDYNGLLREFDRLTLKVSEYDTENHRLEKLANSFREDVQRLQEKLQDSMLDGIDDGGKGIRERVRQLIAGLRVEYQSSLKRESEQRALVEEDLLNLRRERDMERFQKSHQGTQTH